MRKSPILFGLRTIYGFCVLNGTNLPAELLPAHSILCKQKEYLSLIKPLSLSLFTQLNKDRITTLIITELNDGLNDELCTNQLFKFLFVSVADLDIVPRNAVLYIE